MNLGKGLFGLMLLLIVGFAACKKDKVKYIGSSNCTTETFVIPETGLYGDNILNADVTNVYTDDSTGDRRYYSIRVNKDCSSTFKVFVEGRDTSLYPAVEWGVPLGTSDYNRVTTDRTYDTYFVLEDEAIGDAQIYFIGYGEVYISYFLNDELISEKTIYVNR